MKLVPSDTLEWKKDHPTGSLSFKYLLGGDDASPDNFVLILARQEDRFTTERHRHNFDQFRYPLHGDMNVGKGVKLRQGQLGYFPEGAAYGPQDDPLGNARPGEPMHLTLQFGGSSGYGYLSPDRLRACREALRKDGEFVDILYRRHDGRMQGGLEAVWEYAFGTKLKYPKPRYLSPIIMDPASFPWVPQPERAGVARKHLGTFTERKTWAETFRLSPGACWASGRHDARRLVFFLSGSGAAKGVHLPAYSAIQIDADEEAEILAQDELEILLFGLPAIQSNVIAA
jgi:hypothetical protein